MTSKPSQAHLEDIGHSLASLASSIRISNHGYGFYNINKYSEDCLAKVLAIVHDTKFQVLEYRKVNAVAVDIASEDNQWAYQITSQGTASKLKEIILKYLKGGLQNEYKTLRFLVFKEKYNPRISNEAISDFLKKKDKQLSQVFNKARANKQVSDIKSMVFDLTGLAKLIKEYCDNQQLEQI